jgi:DNA-directed RNA polymerase specialized sigma24 family protein
MIEAEEIDELEGDQDGFLGRIEAGRDTTDVDDLVPDALPEKPPRVAATAAFWTEVIVSCGQAFDAYARRRCFQLGVSESFAENAVQDALLAAMTRDTMDGGTLGAAKLVYCIIRRGVINEWRRNNRLVRLPSPAFEESAASLEPADLDGKLVDAGWSSRAATPEQDIEALRIDANNLNETRSVELAWTLLPIYAPGDRAQVKRHLDTLRHALDGLAYPRIATHLGVDGQDTQVLQRLRAWKRRGGLHLRGWVHALVRTQPALDAYTRQNRAFWKVGFVAGNNFQDGTVVASDGPPKVED